MNDRNRPQAFTASPDLTHTFLFSFAQLVMLIALVLALA
jgi:hypothetical protein